MNEKQNLVAHCQMGSSDKLYMACIRVEGGTGQFTVIGKWGRRGTANLQQQVKLQTGNEAAARAEQRRLFEAKLKKGYIDITSPAYSGPLTMHSPDVVRNLEGPGNTPVAPKPKKKVPSVAKPAPVAPQTEIIVECIDNAGLEEWFDMGIEYVGEVHSDPALVWVYDKVGEKQECFKERFKKVANE